MKKLTIIFILLFLTSFTFLSCEKWIDPDLNTDPNNPSEVISKLLLPSVEVNMAYSLGGSDMMMSFGAWMQYFNGYDRQALNYSKYSWTSNDANGIWSNIYSTILSDANEIIKLSNATSPHSLGVAKICTAVTLGHATDLWDDVPYSEAFDPENPNPAYETQEAIYQTIQDLLSEAINELQSTSFIIELDGDLIYGNNTESWIKAAYALKARYALNLSKRNGNAAYTEALGYLDDAFDGNSDDFQFVFTGAAYTESSPLYQLEIDRPMINMCKTFIDTLLSNNDPRLPFYATANDTVANDTIYVGANIGSDETEFVASLGPFKAAPDAATIFMSYMEQKFIEAESEFGLGNADDAAEAYKEAVAASILKVTGAANAGWLDANINIETGATITLEKIIFQKYIALYGQLQPYNDLRRVELPVLPDNPETSFNIPQRYPWAQNETAYNANCPEFVPTTTPVWWAE